jgi:hypothetical protein
MLSLVPFKKGVGFLVSPLNRTLASVTVDVILRETDRDLAVDRSSVFFWKASLSIELPLTAHDPIHPKVSSRRQPLIIQVLMVR